MKKVLAIALSVLSIIPCFGCSAEKTNNSNKDPDDEIIGSPYSWYESFNARICDINGNDVCFWNDGKIQFDDFIALYYDNEPTQTTKTATLGVGVTYTLSMFFLCVGEHDYLNHWSPYPWYSTEYFDWLEKGEPIENWEDYFEFSSLYITNGQSVRFEYDTNKLQILLVNESEMQYSIKALQPCDNEEVKISYGSGNEFDDHTQFYVNAQ